MKPHRQTRSVKSQARAFSSKCEKCGKAICLSCAHAYTDDTNAAINSSSPYLCRECYEEQYGKVKTAVDAYKEQLAETLTRVRGCCDTVEIDRLIEYLKNT